MQAYGAGFARLYNLRWGGFSRQVAPVLLDFYAATPHGQAYQPVLDLCCGAGHLMRYFLEKGYAVTGLDLSEYMLAYAQENAGEFAASGQAHFVHGDACHFALDERFGLVVSTYDALNHLPGEQALQGCLKSVWDVLQDGGYFIFDLNTRLGLRRWSSINVDDGREDSLVITRGVYDEAGGRAWTQITGFIRNTDGSYERVDETAYNVAYEMEQVVRMLHENGWQEIRLARLQDLKANLQEPEQEMRVYFLCKKTEIKK